MSLLRLGIFFGLIFDAFQLLHRYHSFLVDGMFSCDRSPLQDADTIQECEWLAGIYGSRRPQELGAYGWQSCDEIQDQSGRRGNPIQPGPFVSTIVTV